MKWFSILFFSFINVSLCLQLKQYDASSFSCLDWRLYHRCSCQTECRYQNNCCPDLKNREVSYIGNVSTHSCTEMKVGYYISLDECRPNYTNREHVSKCENSLDEDHILKVPAFGKTDKRMYKNLFCALCNNQEYILGKSIYKCNNMESITFNQLSKHLSDGKCSFSSFDVPDITFINNIRECSDDVSNCSIRKKRKNRPEICKINSTSLVSTYREAHTFHPCALCTDFNNTFNESLEMKFQIIHPLTIIFDHSSNILQYISVVQKNDGTNRITKTIHATDCTNVSLFDVYQNKCRSIFYHSLIHCIAVRLDDDEYYINDDGLLYLNISQRLLNKSEYNQDAHGISICVDKQTNNISRYAIAESYITFVGLIISLPALAFTIVVYLSIPELRTLPGKLIISLLSSLFLAELLFLTSKYVTPYTVLCTSMAVLMHYSFLASFFWMNVVSFDAWYTFSGFKQFRISNRGSKRFLSYSLYAWISPLIIVIMSLILEFIPINQAVSPAYGQGVCWIANGNILLWVFIIPVILLLSLNVLAFIFISRGLYLQMERSSKYLLNFHTIHYQIFLKLSLVMGLTWIWGILYSFTNISEFSLLFCFFNSFLGLFVSFSFLSTRLTAKKCEQFTSFSKMKSNITTFSCKVTSTTKNNQPE